MHRDEGIRAAALNRFLHDFLTDRRAGTVRTPSEYEARHPELGSAVSLEIERLENPSGSKPAGITATDAVSTRQAAPLDEVGAEVGPYVLERELGRGGQGAVFLARDTRLGRRVALKLLLSHASWSRSARERFHREAAIAARLDHPGLCTVYESDSADGVSYVALRYVEGETLAARLERGALAPREAARAIQQASEALHVAHAAGIVHRDIKPGNLMLTPSGEVVVLDFGLARELESDVALTHTGDRFGTPAYMAPEQVEPELGPSGPRTDVWALGVTLAEAALGRAPFRGPTHASLYRAIVSGGPDLNGDLPRDLEVILRTALRPEPERRYAGALELARDLAAFREGRPIAARPAGAFERLGSWARRNRRTAAALATAAAGLVVGSAGTTVGWLRAMDREEQLGIAKIEAEETAARAVALNAYLARMIESPNPLRGLGRAREDVTVGEMLDSASETIATAFPDQPDLEAETRLSIGTTYAGLGRYDDAQTHYASALALYRDLHGERHLDTLRARRLHATTFGNLGDRPRAIDELQATFDLAVELLGADHIEVANVRVDLGWALVESERYAESQVHCEAAVERLARSGDHPYELAIATNNLAVVLRSLGDVAGAEAAYQRAIATFRTSFGEDSALAGLVTGNLAFLLEGDGQHERALAYYAEATAALRTSVGEHPALGSTLLGYATALYSQGLLEEAEPVAAEASRTLLATLGVADEEYGIAVELHGFVCSYLSRHAEAEELFRLSAELLREHHGDPGRALVGEAWAAESHALAGGADAGLAELEALWGRVLDGRAEDDDAPQAVARTGVRVATALQRDADLARWQARAEP